MKNRLEVLSFALKVRSHRPLPLFASEQPFPGLFDGIFSIRPGTLPEEYVVECSRFSVFTVAGDLANMADLYEASQVHAEEPALLI